MIHAAIVVAAHVPLPRWIRQLSLCRSRHRWRPVRLEWRRWLRQPPIPGLRCRHHSLFPPPSLWLCYRRFSLLVGTSGTSPIHPRGLGGGGNGGGGVAPNRGGLADRSLWASHLVE
uniref:Uncharacterized protein n=1 Tax=Zea mays TaxID=4577 RepID=A0A804RLB6_MAIZE